MIHICVDPGSTHMGKKAYAKELIEVAKRTGCDSIKFQLFPKKEPYVSTAIDPSASNSRLKVQNVALPYDWFGELVAHGNRVGIPVAASVFDREAMEVVFSQKVPFVKFAYSQRQNIEGIKAALIMGRTVVVSTDRMGIWDLPKGVMKLFCQSTYPTPWVTNFDGLFETGEARGDSKFDGISDHSLGVSEAVRAVGAGALWIEKHITLAYTDCLDCPDGRFALTPIELQVFVEKVREAKKVERQKREEVGQKFPSIPKFPKAILET